MLQVSLTKNIQYELNPYSHSTKPYTYSSDEETLFEQEEVFPLAARNIKNSNTSDAKRPTIQRYQPYKKSSNKTKNNILPQPQIEMQPSQPLHQPTSLDSNSLFGSNILSPSSSTCSLFSSFSSDSSTCSLLLKDDQVFDEFDDFIQSPTRFLSSPPPSPVLSPSENDDDMDFNDFPLFP